jgi:hypothetical protein
MRFSTCVVLSAAWLSVTSVARGDEPPTAPPAPAIEALSPAQEQAAEHFRLGLSHYDDGDHRAALSELRRAFALAPSYRLLFNIGRICADLHDHVCALSSYRQYLHDGGTEIPAERQAEVEAEVTALRGRVATLDIGSNVSGVDISIDGTHVGTTPLTSVLTNPGRHHISASRPGMTPAVRVVDAVGGDDLSIELHLTRLATPNPTPPRGDASPTAPPSRWTGWSWLGVSATAVLATGAVVTGVLSLRASEDASQTRYAGSTPSAEATSAHDRAVALAITSDVLSGVAVATLTTTLVLTFALQPQQARVGSPSIRISPTGVAASGSF